MVLYAPPVNFLTGSQNPPAAKGQEVLRNSIVELCESKFATHAIKAGLRAPDFTLFDMEGSEVNSVDLTRKGPVIIFFLRGLWCWYSYMTLIALETINTALSDRGVSVVAISPQLHFSQADVDRKQAISFPLLCDSHSRIAQEFQVAWRLSGPLKKTYLQLGADLDKLNGVDSELLPMASLYIIDRQGTIVYSEVNPNYVQLINVNEILLVLDNMPQPRKSRAIE